MRVFKNKWFVRFARKENIKDKQLCEAIERADKGLVDADLGTGLIKQRVSRVGEGRSGGYRTIVAYRAKSRAFFVYGFAKNERDNIDAVDLLALKEAAAVYLSMNAGIIAGLLEDKRLMEINCNV